MIQTRSTAVSAQIGGIFAGLCVGYWVLNKFQESWREKLYEESGNFTNISPEEIRCCNSKLRKILEYNNNGTVGKTLGYDTNGKVEEIL